MNVSVIPRHDSVLDGEIFNLTDRYDPTPSYGADRYFFFR